MHVKHICILLNLWELRTGCYIFNTSSILCFEFVLHKDSSWPSWSCWCSSALWDTSEHIEVELLKILQGRERTVRHQFQLNKANTQLLIPNLHSDSPTLSSDVCFLPYFLPNPLWRFAFLPLYHRLSSQTYGRNTPGNKTCSIGSFSRKVGLQWVLERESTVHWMWTPCEAVANGLGQALSV